MNTSGYKNVYFIGIGGISMSSLAMILKNRGACVAGYDMKKSEITKDLEKNGIKVNYTCSPDNQNGFDTVVYTAAISENDSEMLLAKSRGAKIISRAELLGEITSGYRHSVGVAGTHGKSTTTGMLCHVMNKAKNDATVLAGAVIPLINSTYYAGNGDIAVFEACEYKNSYHAMRPTIRLVLNTELDHVDFFGNIENVIKSFEKYMDTDSGESENIALINADCKNTVLAAKNIKTKTYTFSTQSENADFYACNIKEENGYYGFDVMAFGKNYCSIKLSVPGLHNVINATAAAAASYLCSVDGKCVSEGISEFCGVKRRFEKKGILESGALVIDDYAHHPDEIEATLKAAKKVCKGRIFCIFQPHTYTRFEALMEDFAKSLSLADVVVMADVYAAREKNVNGISSKDIRKYLPSAEYFGSFEEIAEFIKENAKEGDMAITMGAGDVYKVSDFLF